MVRRSWVLTDAGLITAAGDSPGEVFAAVLTAVPLAVRERRSAAPVAVGECSMPGEAPPPAGKTSPGVPFAGPRASSAGGSRHPASVPVLGFDPKAYLARKGLKDLSRASQLACAAASRVAAGIANVAPSHVGIALGSAWGSLRTVVEFERAAWIDGPRFVDPLLFTETVSNVPAGQVAIAFGWSAFNVTVSSGTASGLEALAIARELLEEGRAEIAVAGGADELNAPLLRALCAEGSLSASPGSLPLDEARSGPIGGEGACLVTLETEDGARARGARPLARVLATVCRYLGDPGPRRAPSSGAIAATLYEVLDRARLRPDAIDLLVLSAGGRAEADLAEAGAVLAVFGRGGGTPPVVLPKAILAETWGASGPIGVAVVLEAMRTGTIPGRPAAWRPAPGAEGLNLPPRALRRPVHRALVLDASDRGHAAAIALAAPEASGGV